MAQRLLTFDDLAAMPDDGKRREILDGELYVTPSPFVRHQRLVLRLAVAFDAHIAAHGGGEVLIAPMDVLLSEHNVLEPDVLFVAEGQPIMTEKHVVGAPALVIEVLSNARIDRVRKRDIYARCGVPEYWIVDPDADRIEIYRREGAGYGKPEIYEAGETITYGGLPGFALDLSALFTR